MDKTIGGLHFNVKKNETEEQPVYNSTEKKIKTTTSVFYLKHDTKYVASGN